MSVRSKEPFMRFEKFSISSSLPGLLERLWKCCAKVHCRFLAVYFVSEFLPSFYDGLHRLDRKSLTLKYVQERLNESTNEIKATNERSLRCPFK